MARRAGVAGAGILLAGVLAVGAGMPAEARLPAVLIVECLPNVRCTNRGKALHRVQVGVRYRLHAWTVMPNHVHVLLSPLPEWPLGTIVSSWKRFSGREANKRLERTGAFWQVDYWDRFIRNDAHFWATVNYIDANPVKAGLIMEASLWPWGSARFR